MSKSKKNKNLKFIKPEELSNEKFSADSFAKTIRRAARGLFYISETDAEILPFSGRRAREVSIDEILSQTGNSADSNVEERNFSEFFERLTKIQDWFGEEEIENARRFAHLKDLLERNLRDLKIYKIGLIELDIYIVGLDPKNILKGVKTKAVET